MYNITLDSNGILLPVFKIRHELIKYASFDNNNYYYLSLYLYVMMA